MTRSDRTMPTEKAYRSKCDRHCCFNQKDCFYPIRHMYEHCNLLVVVCLFACYVQCIHVFVCMCVVYSVLSFINEKSHALREQVTMTTILCTVCMYTYVQLKAKADERKRVEERNAKITKLRQKERRQKTGCSTRVIQSMKHTD